MLALPVATAESGFFPAMLMYFITWAFMASTGLLLAEVCLATGERSNLVSMARVTLGPGGQVFSWVVYLFLFYSLTLAYVTECGNLLSDLSHGRVSEWFGTLVFIFAFAPFIYLGASYVDGINRLLMAALMLSFVLFIWMAWSYVQPERLQTVRWDRALHGLPIVFVSFAYQGIVPTVVQYVGRERLRIALSILLGSLIPFISYAIWQYLIMGALSPEALALAAADNTTAVSPLKLVLANPYVIYTGESFAFFALVTSFLGVTLGVRDFLMDGLKIPRTPLGKVSTLGLIFIPPFVVSTVSPHIFLTAFHFGGGIGTALLLGLLPVLMAWRLRGSPQETLPLLPGGQTILVILAAFTMIVLYQTGT